MADEKKVSGKTRAGGAAKPFPWEEAIAEQYERTKSRLKGLATEPEAELQRILEQYLPKKGDSREERLQKLEDLAMGFAGTTIGKGVLPTAAREQGLQKFLEPSAVKERLYHGTSRPDLTEFKTGKMIKEKQYPGNTIEPWAVDNRDAVFLTPSPQFSGRYSGGDWEISGGYTPTTYPVRVQVKNPWDYENPEHIESVIQAYKEKYPLRRDKSGAVPSEESLRHHWFEKNVRELPLRERDNWSGVEKADLQEIIRSLGHDAFFVKESGIKNLGVYDPRKIKSAIGNRGTYDITDPDITKAEGGLAQYGLRHSGEGVKGKGYFGLLPNKMDGVSTEISVEDETGEYPLIVPTLTAEELDRLLAGGEPTPEMIDKASSWAATRRKRGESPFASPTELRMPRPKAEGGGVYSPRPGLVFVGQEHGAPADVPQEIRDLANQVGAFYEGSGGDKLPDIRYRGSWDDAASRSVKGYPPEYLYTIFTNTDVNRQKDALVGEGTIFNNLLKNQHQVGYFKDRRFNRKDLTNFLQSMGPEFLRDSQNPATESNVEAFLRRGEQLMWESGDTPARQLANKANESRQRWLLNQPKGVFFMGSDHLQKLKELHGSGKKAPVKKADGGAITDLPDEVNPSNWREHLQNNVLADARALLGAKDGGVINLDELIEKSLKKKDGGVINLDELIAWTLAKDEHRKMKAGGAVKMADGGQTFPLQRPEEVTDLKPRPRTKRDELLEMLSKGVGSVHEFMAKPFGYENPPGEMVSSLIGLPGAAKTLERMAYGDPLTSGAGMTTNLLPETTEAAFLGLGAAPTALKATKAAGKALAPTAREMLDLELANMMKPYQMAVAPEGKAGKIKAPANPVGFYNPAEKAALNLQRKKGPGSAFISDLKKQPGVTDERIAELGLTDLASNPNVTREDVIAAVEQNRIPLRESVRRPYDEAAEYSDTISGIEDSLIYYRGGVKDLQAELERVRKMAPNSPLVKQYEDKLAVMRDKVDELEAKLDSTKPAKFGPDTDPSYSLPGGEDYREIRVRLPSKRPSIKNMSRDEYNAAIEKADREGISDFMHPSHHDNEPNVLFHLRVANHVDEEGKRGLLIDELQSDWHQKGRDKGYGRQPSTFMLVNPETSGAVGNFATKEEAEKFLKTSPRAEEFAQGKFFVFENKGKVVVPDAPFKDNWYQLGLKRAIKEAVDTGMDRVYLTTGARQADRYDLSKHIDRIDYNKNPDGSYNLSAIKNGSEVLAKEELTLAEVEQLVGKDMAKKMTAGEGKSNVPADRWEPEDSEIPQYKTLSGLDLKVGGEGMKQYYDKNYKNYLEKYAKQHGGKLGMTHLKTREEWPFPITIKEEGGQFRLFGRDPRTDSFNPNLAGRSFDSYDDALKARDTLYEGFAEPVYYIDLTDAMRESAKKGQSYADGGGVFNTDPDITDAGRIIPEHTI